MVKFSKLLIFHSYYFYITFIPEWNLNMLLSIIQYLKKYYKLHNNILSVLFSTSSAITQRGFSTDPHTFKAAEQYKKLKLPHHKNVSSSRCVLFSFKFPLFYTKPGVVLNMFILQSHLTRLRESTFKSCDFNFRKASARTFRF